MPERLEEMKIYKTLKSTIRPDMTPGQMIDSFAAMCKIPLEGQVDDLIFRETGIFEENRFCFNLVRQFKEPGSSEYIQLHLDMRFQLRPHNALLWSIKWSDRVKGDFFKVIRSDLAYLAIKKAKVLEFEVYIYET